MCRGGEPLADPGVAIAPVHADDRKRRLRYLPHRGNRIGNALRRGDDDVHESVVALEGERAHRAPLSLEPSPVAEMLVSERPTRLHTWQRSETPCTGLKTSK